MDNEVFPLGQAKSRGGRLLKPYALIGRVHVYKMKMNERGRTPVRNTQEVHYNRECISPMVIFQHSVSDGGSSALCQLLPTVIFVLNIY